MHFLNYVYLPTNVFSAQKNTQGGPARANTNIAQHHRSKLGTLPIANEGSFDLKGISKDLRRIQSLGKYSCVGCLIRRVTIYKNLLKDSFSLQFEDFFYPL
jgi:hypothetical protein